MILSLFLGSMIIDPGGAFGVKYISSILVLAFLAVNFRHLRLPQTFTRIELPLFILCPFILMLTSIFVRNVDPGVAIRYSLFLASLLLIPLVMVLSPDETTARFIQVMKWSTPLVAAGFATVCALMALNEWTLIDELRSLSTEYRIGVLGVRPTGFAEVVPQIYWRWSMWLIPACIIAFVAAPRIFPALMAANLLVMSTAIIVATVLGIGGVALMGERALRRRMALLAVVLLAVLLLVAALGYGSVVEWMLAKFTPQWQGSEKRIATASEIAQLVRSQPSALLIGTGIGSSYFSTFLQKQVIDVEVSYGNMIRQLGLLYFLAFCGYVLWVGVQLLRAGPIGRGWGVGLLGLFLAAGSNPMLMSPIFFTILALSRGVLEGSWNRGAPASASTPEGTPF